MFQMLFLYWQLTLADAKIDILIQVEKRGYPLEDGEFFLSAGVRNFKECLCLHLSIKS